MSKKIKIKQKQKNEWLEVKGETVGERGGVGELGWSCFRVGMGELLGGCEGGGMVGPGLKNLKPFTFVPYPFVVKTGCKMLGQCGNKTPV